MIISHKHKFIFIKTRKTAGTSIEIALSGICGPLDIITKISAKDEIVRKQLGYTGPQNDLIPYKKYNIKDWYRFLIKQKRKRFYNHITASEIKSLISSKVWDSYYKFCFERNSWDKTISHYYWRGGDKKYGNMKAYLLSKDVEKINGFKMYALNNQILVDEVYKFEDIEEALIDISNKQKLKTPIEMPKYKAKSKIRKDNRHYRDILTEEETLLITELFSQEIKLLKYTF